jgi:hypothetical protein
VGVSEFPYYQHTALYPLTDFFHRVQWHLEDTPEEKLETLERTLSLYRLPVAEMVQLFSRSCLSWKISIGLTL